MGKASVIMVLGSISIFLIVNLNMNNSVTQATETAVDHFAQVHARNTANSVAEMLLAQLGDNNNYRVTTRTTMSIFEGTAGYRVIDTTMDGENLIKLPIDVSFLGTTFKIDVFTQVAVGGFIPATVKAAITTNNPVETKGTIYVDGREHDINGNLIANSGTLAIWTTSAYSQGGSSTISGTLSEVDYGPYGKNSPGRENAYDATQVWPGGYPNDPDSILGGTANGFPSGTLKSVAQAGTNGSQYVTSPASLSYPLSGVTYIELPTTTSGNQNEWINANVNGSGILIIHNSATNATIKNINSGTFKGLIIADDIVHIHTTIIGAIIGITSSPSSGNCIGNGSGIVKYSSEAISQATSTVGSTTTEFGFGKKRLSIYAWYE